MLRLQSQYLLWLQEYERLSSFIKTHYDTELQKVENSVKGWNWGQAEFDGE